MSKKQKPIVTTLGKCRATVHFTLANGRVHCQIVVQDDKTLARADMSKSAFVIKHSELVLIRPDDSLRSIKEVFIK